MTTEPNTESPNPSGPQLLPCPFCGGEVCRDYIDDCWHRTIGCERCGISLWMSDEAWSQRAKSPETLRLEATVAEMRAALENAVHRLEWAMQFIDALDDTGKEDKNGRRFILNYDRTNWHNADEWRPVTVAQIAEAREALASAPSGMLEATPEVAK